MEDIRIRNRITEFAKEKYGTEPEYLWQSTPDAAVLRRHDSGKWYGIFMTVKKSRLGLSGEGDAEILNVKCDRALSGSLRKNVGFLPAYHMNKESWISLLLDGSLSTDDIEALLCASYELVGRKK